MFLGLSKTPLSFSCCFERTPKRRKEKTATKINGKVLLSFLFHWVSVFDIHFSNVKKEQQQQRTIRGSSRDVVGAVESAYVFSLKWSQLGTPSGSALERCSGHGRRGSCFCWLADVPVSLLSLLPPWRTWRCSFKLRRAWGGMHCKGEKSAYAFFLAVLRSIQEKKSRQQSGFMVNAREMRPHINIEKDITDSAPCLIVHQRICTSGNETCESESSLFYSCLFFFLNFRYFLGVIFFFCLCIITFSTAWYCFSY